MLQAAVLITDGSCYPNPDGPGGYCALVRRDEDLQVADCGYLPPTKGNSNNRLEMLAVIRGLQAIDDDRVEVRSDSQYVVDNTWRTVNWKKSGWLTSSGSPVKNQDLWEELLGELEGRAVTFTWVKGHNKDWDNELADMICGEIREGSSVPGDFI